MSAFLLCFAAFTALALGMDRHHGDVFDPASAAPRWARAPWPWLAHPLHHPAYLRRIGWALLVLSLWLTATAPGMAQMSLRIVAWVVALSVAAVAVAAMVTWQPRRAPTVAALAMVAGLCTLALGW